PLRIPFGRQRQRQARALLAYGVRTVEQVALFGDRLLESFGIFDRVGVKFAVTKRGNLGGDVAEIAEVPALVGNACSRPSPQTSLSIPKERNPYGPITHRRR